jgi:hypothetical protein
MPASANVVAATLISLASLIFSSGDIRRHSSICFASMSAAVSRERIPCRAWDDSTSRL